MKLKTLQLSKTIKSYLILIIILVSATSYSQQEITTESEKDQTSGKLSNGKTLEQALKESGKWKSKDAIKVDSMSITQVPIFPGCKKKLTNKEQIKCLNKKMQQHVGKKFRISKFHNAPKGVHKIYCSFKISKKGSIIDLETFSTYKQDENEAYRVISSLPKMRPGEVDEKPVNIRYMLPINLSST